MRQLPVQDERLWGLSIVTKDRETVEFVPPDGQPVAAPVPAGPPSPTQMAEVAARFRSPER